SALESGDFLLCDSERRVAVTSVDVGLVFSLGPQLHFFRGRKGKSGRADNFGDDGAVDAVAAGFAAVNGLRLRAELGGLAGFHGKSLHLAGKQEQPPNWQGPRPIGREQGEYPFWRSGTEMSCCGRERRKKKVIQKPHT